jgi:hypothetical protein
VTPLVVFAYSDGPAPGHTGGFDDPTCHTCHFDNSPDDESGSLALVGLPEVYTSGAPYRLEVTLERPDLERGGFQLAARFASGKQSGEQAGRFEPLDARTQVLEAGAKGHRIEYVQHTATGSYPTTRDRLTWSLRWIAPIESIDSVAFHLVGNAANDDDSEFGDFIYNREWVLPVIR